MRHASNKRSSSWLLLVCLAFSLNACASFGDKDSGDGPVYDGISDSMDSLPDCGPESQGSLFWVKDKSSAYECGKGNEWKLRKNAKKPDDLDEKIGDTEEVSPRIVN